MLYGSEEGWPSKEHRLRYISDFCKGRALAVPVQGEEKQYMVRYRTQKRLITAGNPIEYEDVLFYIDWAFGSRTRGMYATNSVYQEIRPSLSESNAPDNVVSYLGYIDLDDVLDNEDEALGVIKDCLAKLPVFGTWLLVSGTGLHINVNGFRSHIHAQSFFEARGVVDDRKSNVEVHMLNDISRIGTVPYEVYKKDDRVICFPFMPWEVDAVFDRDDWREYYASEAPMPWRMPPSQEVAAWNEIEMSDLKQKHWHPLGDRKVRDEMNPRVWDLLPGCLKSAFEVDDRADHQHRIVEFITLFMARVGMPSEDIKRWAMMRAMGFTHPLDPEVAEDIIDRVMDSGLEPPACKKIRFMTGGSFPSLNLGDAGLCPYGRDRSKRCQSGSPWREYNRRRKVDNRMGGVKYEDAQGGLRWNRGMR